MQILMTILYILLFLVFLSVLIMIHELGHLTAAKIFKVYCLEYSIGMGPLLFKYKRKGGETQFSVRAIPFGGYVSMYGEGVTLPEGVTIEESRSLNGIKPWKRAIVLLAGVTMNAVLALTFFFISNLCPRQSIQTSDYINQIRVDESSELYSVLDNGSYYNVEVFERVDEEAKAKHNFYMIDNQTTFDGDDSIKYATCFNFEGTIKSVADYDLSNFIYFYSLSEETTDEGTKYVPNFANNISPASFSVATVHITKRIPSEGDTPAYNGDTYAFQVKTKDGTVQSFGLSFYYDVKTIQYNFGGAIAHSFIDFGQGSTAIVRALGDLFTKPSAWGEVGGIIAIGFETTAILKNNGFVNFLRIWAVISVNLAIFNLLPFPGLDGWQLLVLGIESGTRKKIPDKVKNTVSLIGLGLLLALMVGIIFKDLFTYVFVGALFL